MKVRHQPTDKLYLPLVLAEHLDEWCANKIDHVPSLGGQVDMPEVTYPFGYAYSPRSQQTRVAEEAKQLRITVEPMGEITTVEAPADVWAAVNGPNSGLTRADIERGAGAEVGIFSSSVLESEFQGRKLIIEAFADNDPRWRQAPGGRRPALGQVIATPDAKDMIPDHLDAAQVVPGAGLAGRGQFYCSRDTLAWLAFDAESWPGVRDFTVAQIPDLALARRVEADYPGQVLPQGSLCWGLYEISGSERSAAAAVPVPSHSLAQAFAAPTTPQVLTHPIPLKPASMIADQDMDLGERDSEGDVGDGRSSVDKLAGEIAGNPQVRCGAVSGGNAVLSAADRSVRTVQVRFLPEALFLHLAGKRTENQPTENWLPCIYVAPQQRHTDKEYWIGDVRLRVVTFMAGTQDEFWFSDACRMQICPSAETTAIAVWHPWPFSPDLGAAASRLGLSLRSIEAGRPAQFVAYFPGRMCACREYLGHAADAMSLQAVRGISSSVIADGRTKNVLCVAQDSDQRDPAGTTVRLCDVPERCDHGSISVIGGRVEGRLLRSDVVPLGMAVVDRQTFRRLAFETARSAGELPKVGQETFSIRTTDIMFSSVRDALGHAGMILNPLVPICEEQLIKYKVQDTTSADGTVSRKLLSVVAMSKPTFSYASPQLSVNMVLSGCDLPLEASSAHDVRRYEARVRQGRWLMDNASQPEAVLPLQTAARLFPGQPASACLGRTINARLIRSDRVSGSSTPLTVSLRVVGLAESETAFASSDLVTRLALWIQQKVVYNEATSTFATPVELYKRSGYVRCNVHATEPATVSPVVAELESIGYRTQHHLAEQEGLNKLANVLAAIVAMFVFGSLVNAVITVSITTMMNIRMKINEIGILRAHGVGAGQVINIFGLQGAVIGAMAFALGSVIVQFGEPYLREQIAQTFKIPTDSVLIGSIWSVETAWLLALACVVAIAFSVAGVILPAILVCRMSPAQALQRGA
ncbi:MAG: ABC transporter permease [Planctomycetota bacterium]|nr:ABC transporter permease [Planctomycetota bacterium]